MPRAAALTAGPVVVMPRRGLSVVEAAQYIGISKSKFLLMVAAGEMPRPREIGTRNIWDVRELDEAFDALPHGDSAPHHHPDMNDQWRPA